MATQGKRLLDFVIGIHDPKVIGRTDHDLVDVLVLALCAVMAGAEGWDDIVRAMGGLRRVFARWCRHQSIWRS